MEIIGAAALIAVGLVIAALVYGRTHRGPAVAGRADADGAERAPGELAERTAAIARREDALARREVTLDEDRVAIEGKRQELERTLEQASGYHRVEGQAAAAAGDRGPG